MRILFFGIYGPGLAALQRLIAGDFNVVGVVTKLSDGDAAQPVATWALASGLPILQPASLKTAEFLAQVRELSPEIIAVSAFHRLIPKSVLDPPARGAINVHGSLLPKYRGPNPHKWVIARGESVTGVTVHEMTPEADAGAILAQEPMAIRGEDTAEILLGRLGDAGARLLARTLEQIRSGLPLARLPQDPSAASYFSYPTESDTRIDWNRSGRDIVNLVRGMSPRPGAWTMIGPHRVVVHRASVREDVVPVPAGTVVYSRSEYLQVAAADGVVQIEQVAAADETLAPAFFNEGWGALRGARFE